MCLYTKTESCFSEFIYTYTIVGVRTDLANVLHQQTGAFATHSPDLYAPLQNNKRVHKIQLVKHPTYQFKGTIWNLVNLTTTHRHLNSPSITWKTPIISPQQILQIILRQQSLQDKFVLLWRERGLQLLDHGLRQLWLRRGLELRLQVRNGQQFTNCRSLPCVVCQAPFERRYQ